jgi:hypothetical protein
MIPMHTYRKSHSTSLTLRLIVFAGLFLLALSGRNAHAGHASSSATQPVIRDYRLFLAIQVDSPGSDSSFFTLRRFSRHDSDFVVMVNPRDLSISVVDFTTHAWLACSWEEFIPLIRETTYGKAILEARRAVLPIKDAGFNRFLPSQEGISLTVDLCPSRRPLDRFFFDTLITALSNEESPVPIGIAITGIWLKTHPKDLQWLLDLERQKRILITWINHSYNHYVLPGRDSTEHFLVDRKTDLTQEVLGTERLLMEKGLMPSLFFRFPGLVSNPEFIVRVVSFGLIPVGSDAWLAKEEVPRNGSIVLVHANGNEPWGLKKFVGLLAEKQDSIKRKTWFLYDLRSSVIQAMDSSSAVH